MKNNKGFIGIGLLIAIIVALFVGGGAVYFITKPATPYLKNLGDNILPPVNQNTVVNSNTDTNKPKTDCLPTTTPSITVLYPNGGETFTMGQKITIKWLSCNVNNVQIGLLSGGKDFGELTMTPISASLGLFQVMISNPAQAFTQSSINTYQIGIFSQSPNVLVKSNSFTVQSPIQPQTQNQNALNKTVAIKGVNMDIPSNWQLQAPDPNAGSECHSINCDSSISASGAKSYKIYNPSVTTGVKMNDEDAIYVTVGDCASSAEPCPVYTEGSSVQYPNLKSIYTHGLTIQTFGKNSGAVTVFNSIISQL